MSYLFQSLGIDVAAVVGDILGPMLLPATLIKYTEGTRDADDLAAGTSATSVSYAAKGIASGYKAFQIDGTIIERNDRQVVLIAQTIASAAVPVPGDAITIESATYKIVNVDRDPAGATYTCQVRG